MMPDSKRVVDVVVSGAALVVLGPLLAAIGALVKLDTPGSAFFGHERVGRNFVAFRVWKYRTMKATASGPQITTAQDTRITRVGTWLRKSKIDELPQLVNVLKGEMSLVGPRPEVAEYVELFRPEYEEILSVRPGLTDPASIHFRNEQELLAASDNPEEYYRNEILPAKLELSLAYVRHRSLAGDLRLMARTLGALFE